MVEGLLVLGVLLIVFGGLVIGNMRHRRSLPVLQDAGVSARLRLTAAPVSHELLGKTGPARHFDRGVIQDDEMQAQLVDGLAHDSYRFGAQQKVR